VVAVSPSLRERAVAKPAARLTFGSFVRGNLHLPAAGRLAVCIKVPDAREPEAWRALREDLDASRGREDA
jgi:hypothetical protein